MSRYFELMQQAGFEVDTTQPSQAASPRQPSQPPKPAAAPPAAKVTQGARPLRIDQMAYEEALKLVQRVFLAETQTAPRAVVFAAIDKGGGCSQVAARVAESLTNQVRGSICLVEANFRSPSLPELFGTTNHYGLSDALLNEGAIREFAKPLYSENLWLLSSGSLPAGSSGLLNSERMKARMGELRDQFDYLVIDAPPLTRYADAMTLGQLADGLVLVLEANATRREVAQSIAANLQSAKVRMLGAVLNKRTYPIPEAIYRKV